METGKLVTPSPISKVTMPQKEKKSVRVGKITRFQINKMIAEWNRVWWKEFPFITSKLIKRLKPYVEAEY
jgi:hypothetical protein